MRGQFFEIAFTPSVEAAQEANGSRRAYAQAKASVQGGHDGLGENEAAFIASRDSFYMATVNADGWPYVQHRGGAPGFVKVLGPKLLGIADFRGNRQYVSLGNLADNDRAALFFMDYPRQARLKLLGRVRPVDLSNDEALAAQLVDAEYSAKVERGLLIEVAAFDWNCPQHITQRFTLEEIRPTLAKLNDRIAQLEAELARLRGGDASAP